MNVPLDFNNETPLTLAEVPRHLPKRNGKKVHYSTVYRWVTKGTRGRVLESALIGGIRYTTIEALQRFCHGRPMSPTKAGIDLQAVCRALDEAGV